MANNGNERDIILGRNVSRPQHLITGCQWAETSETVQKGKEPAEGPPMMLGTSDPFLNIDDDAEWKQTFGGSLDNIFSIVNGSFVKATTDNIVVNGIYKDGMSNAEADNVWKTALGFSQVQYIVSQDSVLEGSLSTGWFGAIEELRGVGLRMPTMIAGWGRTIDGLPTDPDPQTDIRKNDDEHKLDRATWKHGPWDLRWDWRRGVWTGFNDLITDQYNGGLMGTNLFGTNPDNAEGFPFLRGKLEDVFWVRQPVSKAGTNGKAAGVQSAEVFTHLNHRWFDTSEDGAAALSSIFIIPHGNSTHPDCHPKGSEHTLGPETTGEGSRIDIKTEAHFFKSAGVDGPIDFSGPTSAETICCSPQEKKYHLGTMLFQNTPTTFCNLGNEEFILGGEALTPCKWVPAIALDECEIVGGHLNDLVFNDVELGALNASLCAIVADYTQLLRTFLNINFIGVADDLSDIEDEVERVISVLAACLNNELMGVWTRFDIFRNEVDDGLEKLVADINAVLAICCEQASAIPNVELPSVGSHDHPDPCKVTYDKSNFVYEDFPEIPCDSCPPIELWVPCSPVKSVTITGGCNPIVPPVPSVDDDCQSNPKITNDGTNDNGEKGRLKENGAGPRLGEVPQPEIIFSGAGFIGLQEGA